MFIRGIVQKPTETAGSNVQVSRRVFAANRVALIVTVLALLGSAIGFVVGWQVNESKGKDTSSTSVQKQQVVLRTQGQLISNIAKSLSPSVVSVETTSQSQTGVWGYYADQQGAGTGIILSEDGIVVTNRHVVPSGTTAVSIVLSDGTRYEDVKVLGRTSENDTLDIAFLKINNTNGKKFTPAEIGNSAGLQVGDPVVAIGNALGQFQNTVTSGIISGFGRSVQASDESGTSSENLTNLIQTDAAINQGNSGGPLVNLEGKVIGINTAIAAGTAQNIGFAMPINDVKGLIDGVIKTGKMERPYLGVTYIPITDDLAKKYDLSAKEGAYVPHPEAIGQSAVLQGSPADKAGIKAGDIITKIGNKEINKDNSITSLLGSHKVGDEVTITVIRDKKELSLHAQLQAAPTEE